MSAVDKVRDLFLNRIENNYNQEEYFVESCFKNETKYSNRITTLDLFLELFFRENNHIILDGKKCVYCDDDVIRRIKVAHLPEVLSIS